MDVFRAKAWEQGAAEQGPSPDPRLQPTPDFGTLGPDSDFAKSFARPSATVASPASTPVGASKPPRQSVNPRILQLAAILGGIVCALLVSGGKPEGKTKPRTFSPHGNSASSTGLSQRDLDRQKPQKQAEILLTRAVSRDDGATDQIQAHLEGWRGKLQWNPQLSDLTTVALNSNDQNVRASAIEVQLAAYGLTKNESTVDALVRQADSSDHAQKIWALWTLGLLGNRGVEAERVVQILTAHLKPAKDSGKDRDEDTRRWAVEGLALVGTTSTIVPLLEAMHDDPSPLVRERAACSLAESGMLSHEQRLTVVPQLISYSDDPTLDAQTRAWAFQALGDITKQRLPDDSAAWRNWYQTSVASGQ
jgi:hypothetical protein